MTGGKRASEGDVGRQAHVFRRWAGDFDFIYSQRFPLHSCTTEFSAEFVLGFLFLSHSPPPHVGRTFLDGMEARLTTMPTSYDWASERGKSTGTSWNSMCSQRFSVLQGEEHAIGTRPGCQGGRESVAVQETRRQMNGSRAVGWATTRALPPTPPHLCC